MTPRLGKVQLAVLRALARHGYWYGDGFGCGWFWATPARTGKILDTLVQHGLVTKTEELQKGFYHRKHLVYRVSDAGRVRLDAEGKDV